VNPLYVLMLFGVAFFGFIVIVSVVKARRKKEKAYYVSAVVSFLMLLSSIFVILNQFILVLVLFIAIGILSVAGLPKTIEVLRLEPLIELQEADLSAPLKVRELLTWKGWFKLESRWGVRKTVCLCSLLNMGGVGAVFYTLSILGVINIAWAVGFTIVVGILSAIYFYHQVGKAMK